MLHIHELVKKPHTELLKAELSVTIEIMMEQISLLIWSHIIQTEIGLQVGWRCIYWIGLVVHKF